MNEDLSFFVALERQVWEALQRSEGAAGGANGAQSGPVKWWKVQIRPL